MSTQEHVDHQSRVLHDVDGVGFDALDEVGAIAWVLAGLDAGRGGFLLTPNVDILRQLRAAANSDIAPKADLVVADGMPVVWASKLAGRALPSRVAGSALIFSLSAAAAAAGRSIFLLGGTEGRAAAAAGSLSAAGAIVAGYHYPPFGFESTEAGLNDISASIGQAQPDIVFVGLGFPKQERLILQLRREFPATWFVGCGGSITFAAGEIARAPGLMQRLGLEWIHRLAKEPRRLARRYLVEDLPYAGALLARAATSRFRGR